MIRPATPDDVPALHRLVRDLAAYEKAPDAVTATAEDLRAALFPTGEDPRVFADVAEVDGELVAMAVWYLTFSTWTGRYGIWLEDLFVEPEHRGRGVGRELLEGLAARADEQGWSRVEWTVLDWNAPAIRFYRSLGAEALDEWTTQRLHGVALHQVAERRTAGAAR
ncbi:GNAT family N-acetyltransferase [Arsenicicoccus sp. oral taxon 190]|uniref:GNAT family N-acetyltransferase n=1 Tax=Arsenicicoccus sp. oral taxon 190 TaxID=1658671 RepID=UPI00067A3991|nr:GNAT family N-acetyltransferase [Arsenicicoccus sp. oral taxon 190]AKT50119.1 GCN5 family acetyltransferase [Arsenicicoccus sp. oral taxon 190]